jgi:DUF971 family protein
MSLVPTKLSLVEHAALQIEWSDGSVRQYDFQELRDLCPCASCREQHLKPPDSSLLPILSEAEMKPLKIEAMNPVGNYAYNICFSDGHDTGIYQITLLCELGRLVSG